jgi:hypothetical protein
MQAEIDCNVQALRRFLGAMVGLVAGSALFLRPPDKGRSKDFWRRSGTAFVRFSLVAVASLAAEASCARLRFRAAIKSMTGRRR